MKAATAMIRRKKAGKISECNHDSFVGFIPFFHK